MRPGPICCQETREDGSGCVATVWAGYEVVHYNWRSHAPLSRQRAMTKRAPVGSIHRASAKVCSRKLASPRPLFSEAQAPTSQLPPSQLEVGLQVLTVYSFFGG
jgi:hypothetical protein